MTIQLKILYWLRERINELYDKWYDREFPGSNFFTYDILFPKEYIQDLISNITVEETPYLRTYHHWYTDKIKKTKRKKK